MKQNLPWIWLHLGLRNQQNSARYYSVEEARDYVRGDESVIVIENNGQARAHSDYYIKRPHLAGSPDGLGGHNVDVVGIAHIVWRIVDVELVSGINAVGEEIRPRSREVRRCDGLGARAPHQLLRPESSVEQGITVGVGVSPCVARWRGRHSYDRVLSDEGPCGGAAGDKCGGATPLGCVLRPEGR